MAATVVGYRSEAVLREEKQLGVPRVRVQRPAVRKRYHRAFAPVLVVDPCAIFHGNRAHGSVSFPYFWDVEEKAAGQQWLSAFKFVLARPSQLYSPCKWARPRLSRDCLQLNDLIDDLMVVSDFTEIDRLMKSQTRCGSQPRPSCFLRILKGKDSLTCLLHTEN